MASETTDLHKEWILNIIDQLRKRKARPDLERICHFIERKHGMGRKETEAHLEKLVDKGIVIKVVYKRGTSYRNATKTRKRTYVSNVLNSNLASNKINEAVQEILKERRRERASISAASDNDDNEPMVIDTDDCDYDDDEGVTSKDIETWLRTNGVDIGPYPVHWAVQREVEAGGLSLLSNGTYAPFREDNDGPSTSGVTIGSSRPQLVHRSMSVFAKRGRPPKLKLSRFQKLSRSISLPQGSVSDVNVTEPEPESAPVPVMPPHLCDFCQQSSESNRAKVPEELLFCKDCNAKAHPSCMNYSPALASRARNTHWQCIDCKTCCICSDPGDADAMLFCDACDKGYHMTCHVPEVEDKPQESYTSSRDKNGEKDIPPPPPPKEFYPNATNWSINDVVDYFHQKGFKEQAEAFKEQEIDGQSLLLLKRSDVLQGLSLKLGPALKIYNHVMRLQTAGQPMTT
ncbi:hypothetical protein ACF0H5_005026 [Mactra antiquata]